ncbi:MAG: hypothetical protein ACRD9Y_03795 [Blastocatellia bacterium]
MAFTDEFSGDTLSAARWDTFRGRPVVRDGKLTLAADANNRVDVQTKGTRMFLYGVMAATIDSSSWKPNGQTTDTSFGFEIFGSGDCHYGVVMIANGNLGMLRAEPDATGKCTGDPKFQEYQPIPNWDALRARRKLFVTLVWAPTGVILRVSNGEITSEVRSKPGSDAIPNVPMRVRLNADFNETYTIESIRVARCEPVFVDEFGGNQLDSAKWEVVNGSPTVGSGKLTLNGGTNGALVQSRGKFPPGALAIAIESTNWKPTAQTSGSNFGFDLFDGTCRYGALLTGNGNLGLLRSDPVGGACSGDPRFQEYRAVPDWDAIRAGGRVFLLLEWSASSVVVRVASSDMNTVREIASLSGTQAVTRLAMPIRLNVAAGETFVFDYVRYTRCLAPLSLVSAASFDRAMLAPESIATIFGSELAADVWVAGALPLPTTLGGTTVKVKDSAGEVEGLAGLDQVNLRLPRTLRGRGEVDVMLTVDGKTANIVRVSIR